MRAATRLVASTAVAAGLVLSAGAAAHADGTNVKDKASDVLYVPDSSNDDFSILGYRASADSGTDLRGMRVKHGKTTVTVRLKFANLAKDASISLQFRSNGRSQSDHFLFSVSQRRGVLLDDRFEDTCTVPLKARTGYKGAVSATIKRSCLDDPDRIKVSAVALRGDLVAENGAIYADALSNTKVQGPSWTKWLKSG
jgi:hypothetical protein